MKTNNNSIPHNNRYSLSIRFSADGFSLYVWDESQSLISSYSSEISIDDKTELEILEILSNQEELNLDFESIRVIIENSIFTTVPTSLYKPEIGIDILKVKFNELDNQDIVLSNDILSWDASLVFICKPNLHSALKRFLPTVEIEHHLYSFINNNIPLNNHTGLYIRFRKELFDIVFVIDGVLSLINTFDAKTPEDFLYYLMSVIENFKMNIKTIDITIFNAESKLNYKHLIDNYIDNCITKNEI